MDKVKTLVDAEKDAILKAIEEAPSRIKQAEILGISRATLFRRLKKHGIAQRAVTNV